MSPSYTNDVVERVGFDPSFNATAVCVYPRDLGRAGLAPNIIEHVGCASYSVLQAGAVGEAQVTAQQEAKRHPRPGRRTRCTELAVGAYGHSSPRAGPNAAIQGAEKRVDPAPRPLQVYPRATTRRKYGCFAENIRRKQESWSACRSGRRRFVAVSEARHEAELEGQEERLHAEIEKRVGNWARNRRRTCASSSFQNSFPSMV